MLTKELARIAIKAHGLLRLRYKSSSKIKILTKPAAQGNNCLVSIHIRCKKDHWNYKKKMATAMREKKWKNIPRRTKQSQHQCKIATPQNGVM